MAGLSKEDLTAAILEHNDIGYSGLKNPLLTLECKCGQDIGRFHPQAFEEMDRAHAEHITAALLPLFAEAARLRDAEVWDEAYAAGAQDESRNSWYKGKRPNPYRTSYPIAPTLSAQQEEGENPNE